MKIIVAITGASGVQLGIKLLELIPSNIEVFAIISNSAKITLDLETNYKFNNIDNIKFYEDTNLAAPFASGSFKTDGFIIIPCSMNTLAKCSVGISDTLITRVFSVMLKEKRNIVIAPREMPYNTIQLQSMAKLSNMGISIAPPVLGYYSDQQTLADMENFLIGKWFDLLHIEHNLYKRWGDK
ncbi:MAG: UbiX family flavin prenyltransferase [Campylobacterota bacterium]|nr:UbiX family flavin prenyltransferase [Campylobacterota bacterium]